jgi:predicted nucleic acid-binding protein
MGEAVVVDTSLAVKWFLTESFTDEARGLLNTWEQRAVRRLVPSWFACEVANVFYKAVRKGTISVPLAQFSVSQLLASVVVRDFEPALSLRALALAHTYALPATYDVHYLALADRENCELWTADERFWNATRQDFRLVRWIGEI